MNIPEKAELTASVCHCFKIRNTNLQFQSSGKVTERKEEDGKTANTKRYDFKGNAMNTFVEKINMICKVCKDSFGNPSFNFFFFVVVLER